jgi:hypothetical protein
MTKGGKPCKRWQKIIGTNQTEHGGMINVNENYCSNLYGEEPVCFPEIKQSDVMPCNVPICSKY